MADTPSNLLARLRSVLDAATRPDNTSQTDVRPDVLDKLADDPDLAHRLADVLADLDWHRPDWRDPGDRNVLTVTVCIKADDPDDRAAAFDCLNDACADLSALVSGDWALDAPDGLSDRVSMGMQTDDPDRRPRNRVGQWVT